MPGDPIAAVQRCYPKIYLACHVDHVRAASTPYRLSASHSALLAHLDEDEAITAGKLARHLGVAASSLSASLNRLETLGYLTRRARPRDRRTIEVRLTPKGAEAMSATSVLDRERVGGLLARLTPAERKRAIDGLELLARAAEEQRRKNSSRRNLRS
jgi:DNA-binding MarR family transcriptional regulator